jgi:hypothetical protein
MKVRFYCDIPSQGVRVTGANGWCLCAMTNSYNGPVSPGFTRVAFDVDMPPNLALPPHDLIAPSAPAIVLEEGQE